MEDWREIEGYNGVYRVNEKGDVKSVTHYLDGRNGSGKQVGRTLKQQKSRKGYMRVSLSLNGKRFTTSAHRLVALCFIPNPKNKPQVNHINGIKNDNRIENLEWCTNSENQIHAIKNKLTNQVCAEKHPMSKLTNMQVLKARKLYKLGSENKELAMIYGVSAPAMSKILRKETYINLN
tara:strand:+ start:178 stop:711 length:534 start_codon:yes stop_codon:yes gene_type:complete